MYMNTKCMSFISEYIILILRVHALKPFTNKGDYQKGKFSLAER